MILQNQYSMAIFNRFFRFLKKYFFSLLTNGYNSDIIVKRFALHHWLGRSAMFEKNMRIAYLLDFYADALDKHIATVMIAYYNDDLSLSEIAQGEGISRQGVRHLIKKGEEAIVSFEEKFGLAKRHAELVSVAQTLTDLKSTLQAASFNSEADALDNAIGIILKGTQDVREPY